MILRNLSVLFLTILIPVLVKASSIESFLMVPWSYIQNVYLSKPESLSIQEQNLTFNVADIPIQVSQLAGSIDYLLNPLEIQNDKTLASSQTLSVMLQISGFNVEKEFTKVVSGVQVKVKLKAECSAFTLSQSETQMSATVRWASINNQIKSQIEMLTLTWPENSWKISPINCIGPKGFADVVQTELQQKLSKPDSLISFVKPKLAAKINNTFEQYLKPFRQNQIFQNIEYHLANVESLFEKGFLFKINIQLNNNHTKNIHIDVNEDLLSQNFNSPVLVFNNQGLQTIAEELIPQRWESKLENFDGFKKLLSSRFMQFFVWPDLWQYPKSSSFPMILSLGNDTKMELAEDLTASFKANLSTWIQSERDGKKWDYLYLKSNLQASFKYAIVANQLVFDISSLNQQTQLQFFPDYVQTFQPSEYIAKKTIERSIVDSLKAKKFNWPLPVIKANPELSLKADRIENLKSHIFIHLK